MNPLNTIAGTIVGGVVLAVILIVATLGNHIVVMPSANSVILWLHVLAGITWIGLLYYFNFIQVPVLAKAASDDDGPRITEYIAPNAMNWHRWTALAAWITGVSYLAHIGQLADAFALGMLTESVNSYALTIGIGAWLGTIMLFNVWVLIWPNQKKVLGMVEATAEEIAKGKRIAFLASRSNTLMSIPMVMSMVGSHHGFAM